MKTDLSDLKIKLNDVLSRSNFGPKIKTYDLEEGRDDEGVEFIRVMFDMAPGAAVSDEDLEAFAESVEDTLSSMDERFASVRFSDADV